MSPEVAAVLAAAAALVDGRRRFMELPADRVLPGVWEAALERAVQDLRAAAAGQDAAPAGDCS
ncbi:hypothetical protein ACFQE0_14720 [Methylobacterium komagatae]|uniref:Uncharacterized protein n=1 Tax=Methylobacterium komagatae TaxID=374425 RepID=A0ABW2BLY3_9HYPH